MSISNDIEIKKATFSTDKMLVDQNDLEIPINSIIHCLGSLFQVTNQGLKHVIGKKIDSETYFADSGLYFQLNGLAFVEQKDLTNTPEAAPSKEGLLASAYRFMTAPFQVRTPRNVTTRNKRKMSNPNKLVGNDSLIETAVADKHPEAECMSKLPTSQEMVALNSRCEKETMKEVMFFIHSYEDFMNCTNEKLQTVISALNAANMDRYNQVKMQYPDFTWQPPLIEISTLVTFIQRAYPAQVVEYTLGRKVPSSEASEKPKEEETPGIFPPTKQKANTVYNENFRNFNEDQLIGEVTSKDRGSYQPPDMNDHNYRSRSRSPETSSHRERNRYDATDRRSRHNSYASRSDNNYNNNLTSSQRLEVKLFLDKISYFDGSNNKEALNFLAQCEEAAEKMKTSKVTIAWSKLAGRADRIMREETRQHEGVLTWELFQATLIEHFYHIPSKERAASLLSRLQQDAHESIGDYVQRSSEIIQVHSGKTNLKEIASSQYGWNLVQGLTNISIKNKIADRIAVCQSLSDVCKLVKQVRREMENREAFTGISAEVEENVEEVNWKQRSFTQRGGNNYRGNFRGRYDKTGYSHRGRGYSYGNSYNKTGQQVGANYHTRKVGNSSDIQCLLCGLKGHKVTNCRKLPRAQELIKQDKQQYWNRKKGYTGRINNKYHQVNEVDNSTPIDEIENQDEDIADQDFVDIDEVNFPTSDLTEEEDQAYYYDD